ncbi:uncharacterized protein HMPREF1541_05329 [Cyphellophora europaea CBS 101466]|uniref:DNA polymerase n=1 Tax=Cyphellophora europaea (strain CBS 101466) TaxID=1220924 RepID=W2RRL4_CYPE1|nr:uncharacterized protein HMPREF1541_05329 [Cyphellophora europaea CBS 101466]ETN39107.1 hypothetical protein HMPREF1541_05329 [Cyphellophora europaea CBS 101466]
MPPPHAAALDLSSAPPIFILSTHLSTEELHEYEDLVYAAGGALTYNPTEGRVFLARISQKKRAAFDLRSKGIWTEPGEPPAALATEGESGPAARGRKRKHPNSSQSSGTSSPGPPPSPPSTPIWPDLSSHVLVIKLEWLDACIKQRTQLAHQSQVVYAGKIITKPKGESTPPPIPSTVTYIKATPGPSSTHAVPSAAPPAPRPFSSHSRTAPSLTKRPPPRLHRTTTSEAEGNSSRGPSPSKLPALPSWATQSNTASYACCRSTLLTGPNDSFISQLQKIKLARILTLDAIGVRAYSTSIAALAAYPHELSSETEILRLPGCNSRIAELWLEWFDSADTNAERSIAHVRQLDADPDLTILRGFYEIWGVGADTARKLYYTHGLKDLDDIVEYHWNSLNRVQQIGVKFYAEFAKRIPRAEVEAIAGVILRHARACKGIKESDWGTERDMVCVIVGGYRRGKQESGDVDVILSHRDEGVTHELVVDVVRSLEIEGWVTHTLTLQTTTSDRDQQTLPFRGEGHGGHGFDSLDKALCVWQDPNFDSESGTIQKNSNIHRRVDIILSPWRTVGCAVLGWSGGTTFQRDLRRFAAKVKGWKFDSSGVRDRASGAVVELEGNGKTWEERERNVMEGLGVGWRPPEERCTG